MALPVPRHRFAPLGECASVGANARPLPTRIHFTDDSKPGAALGVGGALYPEWDVTQQPVPTRVVSSHRLPAHCPRRRLRRRCPARRRAPAPPVSDRIGPDGFARPPRWRRTRHRSAHRSVRRSTLRLLASRTGVPGPPQAGSQPRRPHPARCLRIGHRYGSRWPRGARPPASGSRHTGRHTRRAWRPRCRLRISVPRPSRSPPAGDQNVRAAFRRRRASQAQPASTVKLYAPRRRYPWCGRNSQDRGRYTKSAAARPVGWFPV